MNLIPSERAVLKIVGLLFVESSARAHPLTLLRSRWPVLHSEAYGEGYMGLIKKGLIAASKDGQRFSITNAGLNVVARSR
jgi:hypothetical protein